jgi:hypothetical protein
MAKALSRRNTQVSVQQSAQMQQEEKLMADVQLVLQNLFEREQATVKQIVGYLYDIGTVNLINQKVSCRLLNRPAKVIARYSKPVAKVAAWHWFIRNCPPLITGWLHSKVRFEPTQPTVVDTTAIVAAEEVSTAQAIEPYTIEIRKLRGQVRLLSGALVGTVAVLGSTVVWLSQTDKTQPTLIKQAPTAEQLNDRRSLGAATQSVTPKVDPATTYP